MLSINCQCESSTEILFAQCREGFLYLNGFKILLEFRTLWSIQKAVQELRRGTARRISAETRPLASTPTNLKTTLSSSAPSEGGASGGSSPFRWIWRKGSNSEESPAVKQLHERARVQEQRIQDLITGAALERQAVCAFVVSFVHFQ